MKLYSLKTRLTLVNATIFIITSILIVFFVNFFEKQQAFETAEEKSSILLKHNLAIHSYINSRLKPTIFALTETSRKPEYFDPTWMSSTYAVRDIDKLYHQNGEDDSYYYKEAAINARSPENEADDFERDFIQKLNKDQNFNKTSGVRNIDGKPYFFTLIRGESMEQGCLRCHSTQDQAPANLIKTYGDTRSFNRSIGEAVSAISIRMPLELPYREANILSAELSAMLIVLLLVTFSLQNRFINQMIVIPLNRFKTETESITSNPDNLGSNLPLFDNKEMDEIAFSFNKMSGKLKDLVDTRDALVRERTAHLSEALEFNETLLLDSPLPMGVYAGSGQCVLINDAYAELVGATREKLLGQNFNAIVSWHTSGLLDVCSTALTDHTPQQCEIKVVTSFGKGVCLDCRIHPTRLNNEDHLLVQFIDLTERKRGMEQLVEAKEQADAASRTKSQFLANMSHEIRTPMNGIIALSQLLQMTELNAEQKEYTDLLMISGQNLLQLISDILDLSKIEAGSVELETTEFDLSVEMTTTVSIFSQLAKAKELELTLLINPDVPLRLTGDSLRLRQIITNLIGNAIKFTNEGTIALHISKDAEDEQLVTLRFQVCDSGIGIAQDNVGKIFEAFTQADNSTSIKHGGTGLGLAIARHLVEMMVGSIGVDSQEGQGSTFWFTAVLRKQSETPQISAPETAVQMSKLNTTNIRILLVEDDEASQYAFNRLLSKSRYQVDIAQNGREALKLLEVMDFDLVLMDCRMPIMDGYEATAVIRDTGSKVRNHAIPIIALTANAFREDKKRCLDAGMDDFLSKPIDLSNLLKMIEKWVKLHQRQHVGTYSSIPLDKLLPDPITAGTARELYMCEEN